MSGGVYNVLMVPHMSRICQVLFKYFFERNVVLGWWEDRK
jgi:hypothetical protein